METFVSSVLHDLSIFQMLHIIFFRDWSEFIQRGWIMENTLGSDDASPPFCRLREQDTFSQMKLENLLRKKVQERSNTLQ